ncbi:hypothetical protein TWF481_009985 [Arthrobotrys musiformis]|uniref:Uncharacterized protein n=1 Tax=Arthrobotrys musiformis TaxID=47236 RepID=A0AAV9W0I8_9PEZI
MRACRCLTGSRKSSRGGYQAGWIGREVVQSQNKLFGQRIHVVSGATGDDAEDVATRERSSSRRVGQRIGRERVKDMKNMDGGRDI